MSRRIGSFAIKYWNEGRYRPDMLVCPSLEQIENSDGPLSVVEKDRIRKPVPSSNRQGSQARQY